MVLSEHAKVRMQQRGIPRRVIDWLAAYGAVDYQRGSELYYFNQRSRRVRASAPERETSTRTRRKRPFQSVCDEK